MNQRLWTGFFCLSTAEVNLSFGPTEDSGVCKPILVSHGPFNFQVLILVCEIMLHINIFHIVSYVVIANLSPISENKTTCRDCSVHFMCR